jgi:predicted metal-dependent phosphoesterase TrpH
MPEIVVNLHMHTRYSDGTSSHADLVQAALRAGVDTIIVTDHNVWVNGPEDYYGPSGEPAGSERKVLLLVGEEIHDRVRNPQKNHLLAFGAGRELSTLAPDPQRLIDGIAQAGGISFLAHPDDPAAPAFKETDISWEDWDVQRYTGISCGITCLK